MLSMKRAFFDVVKMIKKTGELEVNLGIVR